MNIDLLNQFIKTRRSVRAYSDQSVSSEAIKRCFDAARWAPSAGNQQAWHFYEVRNKQFKEQLMEASNGQAMIKQAPVVVIVTIDNKKLDAAYGNRGKELYAIQDTSAAIQNFMLMAWAQNLGTCWVGAFHEQQVQKLLPHAEHRPVALIPVGYPLQQPSAPHREAIEDITTSIE